MHPVTARTSYVYLNPMLLPVLLARRGLLYGPPRRRIGARSIQRLVCGLERATIQQHDAYSMMESWEHSLCRRGASQVVTSTEAIVCSGHLAVFDVGMLGDVVLLLMEHEVGVPDER